MSSIDPQTRQRVPMIAFAVCGAMLLIYAIVALLAVSGKSATFDEPLHLVAAFVESHLHDDRIDPEDPALFKRIAAIGMPNDALHPDRGSPFWRNMPLQHVDQWSFVKETMYHDPRVNAAALLASARERFIVLAVALGALIGWWAFQLGGAPAAFLATAAFCADPNFLAHGALVKNDVASALAMLAVFYLAWRCGQSATPWRCTALTAAAGFAATVKFSGLFTVLMAAGILFGRALLPGAWIVLKKRLKTRFRRAAGAAAISAMLFFGVWIMVWASYGFRFAPAPDDAFSFDIHHLAIVTSAREHIVAHPHESVSYEQALALPMSRFTRMVIWANDSRLAPQSYLAGFLYTYQSTLLRDTYLCGKYSLFGWWYYFPLTMAFKTPLALMAAGLLALGAGIALPKRWLAERPVGWTALCLLAPPAIYLLLAMHSNLNLGIRHVLPVYAFADVAIGVCAAAALQRWRRATLATLIALGIGLLTETAPAYPNFIPFFNAAAGGSRGGLHLLGDSNLDWGQDLPLLAAWQKSHPDERLYIDYFGTADPRYYGINATPLIEQGTGDCLLPSGNAILAVSATELQGVYLNPQAREALAPLMNAKPLAVLGGSIYLFRWPLDSSRIDFRSGGNEGH